MGFFDSIVDAPSTTSTAFTTAATQAATQAAVEDARVITNTAPAVDILSAVTLHPIPTNDFLIIEDTPIIVTADSVPDMVDPMAAQWAVDIPDQATQDSSEVLIFDTVEMIEPTEIAESLELTPSAPQPESVSFGISETENTITSTVSIVSPDETLARAIAELQASDIHNNQLAQAAQAREVALMADKVSKNTAHEAELESLKAAHLKTVAFMDEQIAAARKEVEDIKTASKRTAYLKELLEAQVTV